MSRSIWRYCFLSCRKMIMTTNTTRSNFDSQDTKSSRPTPLAGQHLKLKPLSHHVPRCKVLTQDHLICKLMWIDNNKVSHHLIIVMITLTESNTRLKSNFDRTISKPKIRLFLTLLKFFILSKLLLT
jgi:hypothetical protein